MSSEDRHVMKRIEGSLYCIGMSRAMLMALERKKLNLNHPFYSFTKRREALHYTEFLE